MLTDLLCALNAATSRASEAPSTTTSRCFWIYRNDSSYFPTPILAKPSREGVNSGRGSSSSSSAAAGSWAEAPGAGAEVDADAVGLRVSNSVVVVLMVFLGLEVGSAVGVSFAGTYYERIRK